MLLIGMFGALNKSMNHNTQIGADKMGFYVYCYQCQGCFVSDSPKTNQICPECSDRNRKQCDLSVDPKAAKDFADLCHDLGYDQPEKTYNTFTPVKVQNTECAGNEFEIEFVADKDGDWIPSHEVGKETNKYTAIIQCDITRGDIYQVRMKEDPCGKWVHIDSIM